MGNMLINAVEKKFRKKIEMLGKEVSLRHWYLSRDLETGERARQC